MYHFNFNFAVFELFYNSSLQNIIRNANNYIELKNIHSFPSLTNSYGITTSITLTINPGLMTEIRNEKYFKEYIYETNRYILFKKLETNHF